MPIKNDNTVSFVVGENSTITNNSNSTSASFADIPGSNFTIPSDGTWEIEFTFCMWNSQGNSIIALHDNSNVVIANSYLQVPPNSNFITQSQTVIVTTTASKIFKLRWKTSLGTMFVQNNTSGTSKIIWKKVS